MCSSVVSRGAVTRLLCLRTSPLSCSERGCELGRVGALSAGYAQDRKQLHRGRAEHCQSSVWNWEAGGLCSVTCSSLRGCSCSSFSGSSVIWRSGSGVSFLLRGFCVGGGKTLYAVCVKDPHCWALGGPEASVQLQNGCLVYVLHLGVIRDW